MSTPRQGPILKPRLDSNLPPIQDGTLATFITQYNQLADRNGLLSEDYGKHTKLALTGIYCDPEPVHRLRVHPKDREVQSFRLTQSYDVDSIIGFIHRGDLFPLAPEHTLFYNVFNNTDFTLESSLHLPPYMFPESSGNETPMQYHHIPNAMMGHIGGANVQKIIVRFMFPGLAKLREARQGSKVAKEYMHQLYKHAVRPSVNKVIPRASQAEWPLTSTDELWRATRGNGQVVFMTRSITAEYLDAFIESLHENCDDSRELRWARGFFLQIQIQGCKHSTQHQVPVPLSPLHYPQDPDENVTPRDDTEQNFEDERGMAVVKALEPLDFGVLNPDNWWLDLATTIHYQDAGYSLLMETSMHHWLISEMTGVDAIEAGDRVRKGESGGYFRDDTAHLGAASGFRLEMKKGKKWGNMKVEYAQAYTTEKSLTALKDKGFVAKHVQPWQVLSDYQHALQSHFIPLERVFRSAMEADFPVDVRLECRVGWGAATRAYRWFEPEALAGCLMLVKTKEFWQAKLIRLESIIATLGKMNPSLPLLPRSILCPTATLVIALCFMTNALVNRPQSQRDFQILADSCSVHVQIGEVLTAVRPLNIFHLHSLVIDGCPRLSSHQALEIPIIARLCGILGSAADADLLALIKRTAQAKPSEDNTLPAWGPDDQTDETGLRSIAGTKRSSGVGPVSRTKKLKLRMGNHVEQVVAQDEERIAEPEAEGCLSADEDPENSSDTVTNRQLVNNIFNKMSLELMLKVPSISVLDRSWRRLPDNECHRELRWSTLCDSTELPRLLVCWRQVSDPGRWEATVNKFFPTWQQYKNGKRPKRVQGLDQCTWYGDWEAFMRNEKSLKERLTSKQLTELVEYVHMMINTEVQWLPLGKSDRLWAGAGGGKAKVFGDDMNKTGGMVILFNPAFDLDTNVPGGR